jgi:hypothetical protein
MENVGLLILGSVLGAVLCARSRSAGGAAVFTLIAAALFLSTPAGADVPEAATGFLKALNSASTPVLTEPAEGSRAVG